MLRLIVLLLLLANGGFYAWSQGLLQPWGLGPVQQSEPQRVQQQLHPETLRVLPPAELRKLQDTVALAPRPPDCLATAALDEAQAVAVRTALQSWPAGSWNLEPVIEPARWIIYMGKYPGVEQVAHKRAELRQLGIAFDEITDPQLQPGLSLGGFPTETAALQQLALLSARGVHTARVLQEHPEKHAQRLLLPAVDDKLRPRLEDLKPVLATKPLRSCRS
jgi:hypothetical protein